MALEQISETTAPARALFLRALLLERERIAKEKQDTKEKRVKNIPNL